MEAICMDALSDVLPPGRFSPQRFLTLLGVLGCGVIATLGCALLCQGRQWTDLPSAIGESVSVAVAPFAGKIDASNPEVVMVADAIKRISADPMTQLYLVETAAYHRVEYQASSTVWGRAAHIPSMGELVAAQSAQGWTRMRGDCTAQAVFMASALANLGLPWRFARSTVLHHAWVQAEATNGGEWFDLNVTTERGYDRPLPRSAVLERLNPRHPDELQLLQAIGVQEADGRLHMPPPILAVELWPRPAYLVLVPFVWIGVFVFLRRIASRV